MMGTIILAAELFIYMNLAFLVSVIKKRNDIADIAWGLGFILIAWSSLYIFGFSFLGLATNILVTIWGIRLSSHIYSRNKNKPEDRRYQEWREKWDNFYFRSYMQIFILQGLFLFLIAIPIISINFFQINNLKFPAIFGILIWTIGFFFESTSDRQLKQFISDPKNKGKIMTSGLWQYSRHPNYFGEITQWWGIFFISLSNPFGWFTIIGPLTISFLIIFVSGIPLLEKKYAGRPDFEKYKKQTSVLLPLPQRK